MAKLVKLETTAGMQYTPKYGYITTALGTDEKGQITELVKKYDGTFTKIGGGGEGSDGYVAVDVDGVLMAQKLTFNGTEPVLSGTPVAIPGIGLFNTGMEEPAYKGSGSSDFYKCASVNAEAQTWSGYLAVLGEDGIYTFEETVTEGLTYGNGFTPEVGGVYSEGCFAKHFLYVGWSLPTPVFKLVCDSKKATAETGQEITWEDGAVFDVDTETGKTVLNPRSGGAIIEDASFFPEGNAPFSVRSVQKITSGSPWGFWNDYYNDTGMTLVFNYYGDNGVMVSTSGSGSYEVNTPNVFTPDEWFTSWLTYDGSTVTVYINGTVVFTDSHTFSSRRAPFGIGMCTTTNSSPMFQLNGLLESVQVWNHCISAEDIQKDFEQGV